METITYVELRELMDRTTPEGKSIPFAITFVTANRQTKQGGDFVTIPYAIKHINLSGKFRKKHHISPTGAVRRIGQGAITGGPVAIDPPTGGAWGAITGGRGANHYKNQTTNLAILARDSHTGKLVFSGEIVKIHYRLVLFINNKEVLY
jgi:hypothetical protein